MPKWRLLSTMLSLALAPRVTPLARGEKRLLIVAFVLACLVGGLAARFAYMDEAEAQFHGGVLKEDAAEARFALFWEPASAFARWGVCSLLIVGVGPIAVWRLLRRSLRGAR